MKGKIPTLTFDQRKYIVRQIVAKMPYSEIARGLLEIYPDLIPEGMTFDECVKRITGTIQTMKARDDAWAFAIEIAEEKAMALPLTNKLMRQQEAQSLYNKADKYDPKELNTRLRIILAFGPIDEPDEPVVANTGLQTEPDEAELIEDPTSGAYHYN